MAIKTVVKHPIAQYTNFYTTYSIEKIGFNLKLLECVAKGYTDGTAATETETDPVLGEVQVNTRIWTNEDAANEWVALVLREHPSQYSAEVISE